MSASATKSKAKAKISQAQHAARKSNAQMSTGPKTEEGKARAAQNALLHGLCSLAPVLRGEDPAEFEQILARWTDEQQPATEEERQIVFNMVCATVAMGRVRKADAAAAADRIRRAGEAFDRLQAEGLAAAVARVDRGDPDAGADLVARADGVRWMIATWEGLDERLVADGHLDPSGRATMLTLLGRDRDDFGDEAVREVHGLGLALAIACDAPLDDADALLAKGVAIDDDRPMERLRETIASELEALRSILPDLEAEEAELRQQALDAAIVDTSDEGARRHRYLQDHQRAFRQFSATLIACKTARLKLSGRILWNRANEPARTPAEPAPAAPKAAPRNEPKNDANPVSEVISVEKTSPAPARPVSKLLAAWSRKPSMALPGAA